MSDTSGPRRWSIFASVFFVSFAVLAFEISLVRIFSVLFFYHYAFLIVSGTVCGLGLGALLWHLLGRRDGRAWLDIGWAGLAFALLIPATIVLLFGTPFLVATHVWTAFIPLLPFIFAGAFLAEAFRQRAAEGGRIYQADMAGAALAAVVAIPLISLTGALNLVFLLGGLAALGPLYYSLFRGNRVLLWASVACVVLLPALWPVGARTSLVRIRPVPGGPRTGAKVMLRLLADPDRPAAVLDSAWSAYARTDLVRSDALEGGFYALDIFTDAGTPSLMVLFKGNLEQVAHLRWLPYLAFDLPPRRSLLSIGPGAGLDFLWGALAGFEEMDGVEINASSVRMMKQYRRINGDLYSWPGVTVTVEDGRSFVRRSQDQYDLIVCSLTQTATADSLGLGLVESYIHTQEAFGTYFDHLTPDGRYALVTESGHLLLRAAFTAIEVMGQQGIDPAQACQHLMALGAAGAETAESPYGYLLIWKRSPLTSSDIARVAPAIAAGIVESVFIPGIGGHPVLEQVARGEAVPHELFSAVTDDSGAALSLRPATDDHPFFLDLSPGAPAALKWLLLASVGVAFLFSGILLRTRHRDERPVRGWVVYFGALGAGFMLVEIPLVQKSMLLLGHPTLSLAAILFYLLIGASAGSRLSQGWPLSQLPRRVAVASLSIACFGIAYALFLSPVISFLLPWPLFARLLALGVLLLPVGLALGIPFPSGLRLMSVSREREIPWMWGVNGLMSVAGSTLAVVGAKMIGFNACLLAAAAIYGGLAISLRGLGIVPERASRKPAPPRREQGESGLQGGRRAGRPSIFPAIGLLAPVVFAIVYTAVLVEAARSQTTSLHQAALRGRTEVVAQLLDRGADVNAKDRFIFGWTPLIAAAFAGHVDTAQLLLAKGADVSAQGDVGLRWTPLSEAAFAGHVEMIRLLLAAGAKVNARDGQDRTPLHGAARVGHAEAIELLIANGAEPNAQDSEGHTPLHLATALAHIKAADLLLAAGVDADAQTKDGSTPLHLAASFGDTEFVRLLVSSGVSVDARQEQGMTALHIAAGHGFQEIAAILLEAGAAVNASDSAGCTPLWWARRTNRGEVADLLRRHGGAQ